MTLRSPVESAHDSASRVGVRERLDLASAPTSRRRARLSLSVEFSHDSAGRVSMREKLDRPRRPPTGGARGFFWGPRSGYGGGPRSSSTGGPRPTCAGGPRPKIRARQGVRALATVGVRAPVPLGVRALPALGVRAPCRTVAEVLGERLLTSFLWAPQGGSAGRFLHPAQFRAPAPPDVAHVAIGGPQAAHEIGTQDGPPGRRLPPSLCKALANRRCMRSAHKPAFPACGCHGTQAGPLGRRLPALCKAPANRRRMRSAHKRPWRQAVATAHKPALPAGGCHLLSVRDPAAGGGCQRTLVHAAV
jgi:hypothetical protein